MAGDLKAAIVVATTTTTTGFGTWLDLIPDNIGKLAAVIGIFLSLVLIYTHLRRGRAESRQAAVKFERTTLELQLLKDREASRIENIAKRQRREGDDKGR
jgi:hypothetical protein